MYKHAHTHTRTMAIRIQSHSQATESNVQITTQVHTYSTMLKCTEYNGSENPNTMKRHTAESSHTEMGRRNKAFSYSGRIFRLSALFSPFGLHSIKCGFRLIHINPCNMAKWYSVSEWESAVPMNSPTKNSNKSHRTVSTHTHTHQTGLSTGPTAIPTKWRAGF